MRQKWYIIMGASKFGTEEIDRFETRKEAKENLKEYRLALPTFSLWITSKTE